MKLLLITLALIVLASSVEIKVSHDTKVGEYFIPTIRHTFSEKRDIGSPVEFSIDVDGKKLAFTLKENRMFSESATVKTFDGNAEVIDEVATPVNHFVSADENFAQFTFFENGLIKGSFFYDDELYLVDPKEEHGDSISEEMKRDVSDVIVFKSSDIYQVDYATGEVLKNINKRAESLTEQDPNPHRPTDGSPTTINSVPLFPQGQCTIRKLVKINIAVDAPYYHRAMKSAFPSQTPSNNLVTSYVTAIFGTVSQIYERQFGVTFQIDDLQIYSTWSNSPAWQQPNVIVDGEEQKCVRVAGDLLPLFRTWAAAQGTSNDRQWHLLTDCYTPRFCTEPCSVTVGIAYVGVLCTGNGYNTGFSSWGSSPGGWLTIAHELGHNFRASHDFNDRGVMSYVTTSRKAHEFNSVSSASMCEEIRLASCMPEIDSCVVNCGGKECGPSNCPGANCGSCDTGDQCNSNGACVTPTCNPNCAGVSCGGSDGCGGTCDCPGCTQTCTGRQCGTIDCGDVCGTCSSGQTCSAAGQCVVDSDNVWLSNHNSVRSEDGVAAMSWSEGLENSARQWAQQCQWAHSRYGENLYATTQDVSPSATPLNAVTSWANEKNDWNCAENTCNGVCGHYTQIVWEDSTELGCECNRCNSGSPFSNGGAWTVCVCHYNPVGNYIGQRPFPTSQCENPPCTPSCAGKQCGASDGCSGTCVGANGICGANSDCNSAGECVCQPSISCNGRCGQIFNGCTQQQCPGTCGSGQTCSANGYCEDTPCVPNPQCGNRECGDVFDGCQGVSSCGSCSAGSTCDNGQCVDECTCTGLNQLCNAAGDCECVAGYVFKSDECVKRKLPSGWRKSQCTSCDLSSADSWQMSPDVSALKSVAADDSVIEWEGSSTMTESSTSYFTATVKITKDGSGACAGVALGVKDTNYLTFCLDMTNGLIARDIRGWWYINTDIVPVLNQEYTIRVKLHVVLTSSGPVEAVTVNVENGSIGSIKSGPFRRSYWSQINGANVGLYASTSADFTNIFASYENQVILSVANCDNSNLPNEIAIALGSTPSAIDIEYENCGTKRQAGAATAIVTITSTVASGSSPVVTSSITSSATLASTLITTVSTASPILAASSSGITAAVAGSGATVGTVISTLTAGGLIATSGVTIAVISSVAGVVVVGGAVGAAVYVAKSNDDEGETVVAQVSVAEPTPEPSPPPVQEIQPTKPKGVDIFNMDPTQPQSLTARQQY